MSFFRIFIACLLSLTLCAIASPQESKASWAEYKSGLQAFDTDPLTAIHYFDLALDELYSEQQLDSLGADSTYFSEMTKNIVFILESLYPKLVNQGSEQSYSARNDYENYDEFDEFDEFFSDDKDIPLDSMEKIALETFLDSTDLSKLSFPIEINDRVLREIHFLTVNVRKFTDAALSRKTALDSMIYSKLRKRGLPEDLIYLAFVESGFKTNAYSRAKAAGVWQFIPATGKRYNLPIDFWLDMRYNPEAATDAALDYLTDLYDEFGDWYLAMAAYNCGEGRIRRLVKEGQATDPDKKVSYWDLKLPRETMHYVPRILAATIIGHFPERYAFTAEKQSLIPFDTVTVKDCIPLDKVGPAVGSSVNTIRDLNPELVRFCTPPNLKSYTIRIPEGTREKFLAAYDKMDKTQLVRWQQYKVQRGDNLGSISRLFGVKAADIQSANNLRKSRLRVGQVLIIPMGFGAKVSAPAATATPAKKQQETKKVAKSNPGTSYEIKQGDSLWDIARNHNVTVQQLLEWNPGLDKKIYPGMKIKVGE